MQHLPFDKAGRFWRGNLHTHSTFSDGTLTPQQVCQVYREAGYHFLAITDHFMQQYGFHITDTRAEQRSDFTMLLGAELHAGETELGHLWHVLAVGLPHDFAPNLPHENGSEIAARALAAGAFVAAAHPDWYGLTEGDILSLGAIHAIEIYNATSSDHNDKPGGWSLVDVLLMRGKRYFVCATDDAHFKHTRQDALRGWVWVKSESLTPEALLAALKRGEYYSSTGPQLYDVQMFPGDKVLVRCSPASAIFVTGHGSLSVHTHGQGLREAELSLRRFNSPYCRITVRDAHGERAWTNPIWFT
ncbi:MAG: CehA/McbA family metallohydrolase [Chloroflexi bacterium]|nr:CehA/McbA family metallohydrolase [Chloroflexota bacterium]